MTDYFKTIRAYLRGKWGRKSRAKESRVIVDAWLGCENPFQAVKLGWNTARDIEIHTLKNRIQSLRRNKKKHSHLQKQLDDLLNGGAQINDQQTENTQ